MSEVNGHGRTQRRQRGKPLRGGGHQANVDLEQAVSTDLPAASTEPYDASVAFDFRGVQLRTVKRLGQTWFVAADICAALDIANPRDALARLRENEKGVGVTDTPGGRQEVNIVNESGVYGLAFRSRKQEAEDFRYWVTNEVIPSIRKTGRYEAGAPVLAGAFDWLNVPGRYMTLVKSATDRTTYELPIECMIGEVTGTDVHILAHQIKLIELTWLRMRQFDAVGLNLGLTRMAEACSVASLGQLAWTSDWHIRDETYALALRRLVNQQQREPFAARFGSGTASSSDGQFFQAAGFGRDASRLNAHYGQKPGFKVYTHLSDRYGPFFTKLIAATASEALHVLDALLYHQSEVPTGRHHTDGGGDSDHVFALCSLLGFQFAPRIPDLKHRRLYSFGKPSDYPTLEPMIAGRINLALIRAHWKAILRIVASIRTGTVTASVIMRQLAAYPRQNGVAAALRELGRLERTLFTLDWIEDPELRRSTGQELNKGESRNSLARAVFIHRLGEIRDRTYENQQHRASGLNLVVTAIVLWNTRYLERAVATLRQTEDVPDHLLAHLSPLGWEHVNLTGDYIWAAQQTSENTDGLKPLRPAPERSSKPPDVPGLSPYAYQKASSLVLATMPESEESNCLARSSGH